MSQNFTIMSISKIKRKAFIDVVASGAKEFPVSSRKIDLFTVLNPFNSARFLHKRLNGYVTPSKVKGGGICVAEFFL